jgi:hypothetical protein
MKEYPGLPAADDFVVVLPAPRFLQALDRYMEEETEGITRSVALNAAFEDWCLAMGYISREYGVSIATRLLRPSRERS